MASDRRATKVWKRLVQSYGPRFVEAYGKDPNELWLAAIQDLSDEQIAHGIRQVQRDTPIHPPTLGQFAKACNDMPVPQNAEGGPSIQEQLCEYTMLKYFSVARDSKFSPDQMRQTSQPWTYLYREWFDATRAKGRERCAECTGVLIPACGGLEGFRVNAADMLADADLHRRVMQRFSRNFQGDRNRTLTLTG